MRVGESQRPAGVASISACHNIRIRPRPPDNVKRDLGPGDLPPIAGFPGHQRAFVKVQDGCDAFCSYCLIPRLRTRVWSRPIEQVLREARALVAGGHKEVVLCGVFLGAYGQDTTERSRWLGGSALAELVERVAGIEGLWRVRLSSLEAGDVTRRLLEVCAGRPTVAPHLHVALQSGSDAILRRMNRRYTREQFLECVGRIRRRLVAPAITTDVIVGFPGESEEDFAATLALAEEVGFAKVHVFPFSPRPGTAAWAWRGEMPPAGVVKDRCKRITEVERATAAEYRRQFVGQTVEALVEQPNTRTPPGWARGLTDRYVEVVFPLPGDGAPAPVGQVVAVRVTGLPETGTAGAGMIGRLA